MATISGVNVTGLAGSERTLTCTLNPRINVFFGKNGGGKTTLLRTLYSALRADGSIIADSPVRHAEIHLIPGSGKQEYWRRLTRSSDPSDSSQLSFSVFEERTDPVAAKPKWISDLGDPSEEVAHDALFLSVSRLYRDILKQNNLRFYGGSLLGRAESPEDPATREPSLEASFVGQLNKRWTTYSNQLLGEIKSIQQAGIGSILEAVLLSNNSVNDSRQTADREKAFVLAKSFFDRQPELRSLTQNKHNFLNYYDLNPSLRAVMRKVEQVEAQIAAAQEQRESLSKIVNLLFSGKSVTFSDNGLEIFGSEGKVLTLAQLSTGEKQMLSLCVEVLSVGAHTPVLIDEPEMSLHLAWQKVLLNTLSILNPTVQLIVATHSPEIMAEIDDEFIFRI